MPEHMGSAGPTTLISPLNTLKNWGNSSRFVLRKNIPIWFALIISIRLSYIGIRINFHTPEFYAGEWVVISAGTFLDKENRSPGFQPNENSQ